MVHIPDIDAIVLIAEKAGKRMQSSAKRPAAQNDDAFPTTEADATSHILLWDALTEFDIQIISEEARQGQVTDELLWIIDPLDGTSDFMEGSDEWSVMIALLKGQSPIMGVIAIPSQGRVYAAERGKGVFVFENGEKREIVMAARPRAGAPRLLVSRSHYSSLMKEVAMGLHANEITMSSIGYKSVAILEGRGDLQLTDGNLGEWDVAAAQCILEEAGGAVTDLSGERLTYRNPSWRISNGFVGGTRELAGRAIAAIQKPH